MTDRGSNDFKEVTRRAVALRAGYRCSFPGCGQQTVGPSDESPSAVTNIGVVAHICAASPHGPRYVASMTTQERSDVSNAIWLCSNHAALIDRDITTYTVERLREMKREHETASAESVRRASLESCLADDLVAIGPGVICTGDVMEVDASGWSIQVRHFVDGNPSLLIGFIDQFETSPTSDRYILVNALGDGRVLLSAPALKKNGEGYLVKCPVAPGFPRIEAQRLGSDYAISPTTDDLYLDNKRNIARVSGVEALPQRVRSCLSMQRGESPFHGDFGVRIAEYFDAFRGSPWLGQLIKLEVIRQAAIPYRDEIQKKDYTPLQCVERVWQVEALADVPENQWLPVRVEFDVRGVGRWQHELKICIPSADMLATIQERQKDFAVLRGQTVPSRAESVIGPPEEGIQDKAYRLLKEIKAQTEASNQPIFVAELAPRLKLSEREVQESFRYLKGKRWIDTFNIDYTARINAAGHDAIAEIKRRIGGGG